MHWSYRAIPFNMKYSVPDHSCLQEIDSNIEKASKMQQVFSTVGLIRVPLKALHILHQGHFGMQRMKQLARTAIYWLNINTDTEDMA
ncbi:Pol polyprotein [Plakobranchus ocellatus]|uniref:Pol polyprotein n=1 Tax=Plakobranchus ocellatus TaxID=259542 RepID=A0AAV3Y3H9_9GAST|nr:Pol polyprotein [Plakobranchus ocellatus]